MENLGYVNDKFYSVANANNVTNVDTISDKQINAIKISRKNTLSSRKLDRISKKRSVSFVQAKTESVTDKEWSSYNKQEKISYITFAILKIILFIVLLYLFLLSLNFMTIGFTMVAGYAIKAGPTIKFILANPFAALAIGIIATAIMQNATATTSIAVSMVGAGIIPDVQSAIPIIMGSNIGTCVTNSLIALTLAGDPNEFKRAFSGATLNDMFNLLTTSLLLPIEILSHFLYVVSTALANLMPFDNVEQISKANFMASILNPLCDLFILLDADAVNALASGSDITKVALRCCETKMIKEYTNYTNVSLITTTANPLATSGLNDTNNFTNKTICLKKCTYWCMPMIEAIGDGGTGLFWIIFSIIVLIVCLFGIVKVLSLLIVGPIAKGVRIAVNASFPKPFGWLTEILLFIIAFLLTIVVQSSNIITATLVPLCGVGIVSLQRVFVMTLGSNIGTTVTGILTAFTQPASSLKKSMQLAFVYTLFNSLGVLFWLPIPFLRFPKQLATGLGNIVFQYRWFLYCYVLVVYFIGPLIIFGLALIPMWIGLAIVGIPSVFIVISIIVLYFLQSKCSRILPNRFKTFNFLPVWLRSLEPLNRRMKQLKCCCCRKKTVDLYDDNRKSIDIDQNEGTFSIPNVIRRMSAIEGLVNEGISYTRRNSLTFKPELDDLDDEEEDNSVAEVTDTNLSNEKCTIDFKDFVYENDVITRF